jgi:hypothetical protein
MTKVNSVTCDVTTTVWPYVEKTTLATGNNNGIGFSIQTDTEGRLIVSISNKLIQRQVVFQPLEIQEQGTFVAHIKFDIAVMSLELVINKIRILPDKIANGEKQEIKTRPYVPRQVEMPDLINAPARSESERFFLNTVNDLMNRYNSEDSYETLKIAGLLRLLLLDNPCLIDIINKEYKLKLEYSARDVRIEYKNYAKEAPSIAAVVSLYAGKGNNLVSPGKVRNAFLKLPFGAVDGQWTTVEDVVLYCANKAGGVHYDQSLPTKPGQKKILEIDKILTTRSKNPIHHRLLHQIAFITLDAIKPLIDAVITSAKEEANNEPAS